MIALFAGSFHPPTNGHLDVIRRAACMFERVVVAVMVNPEKKYLLSAEERCEMLRRAAAGLDNVEVVWGTGLTAELAKKLGKYGKQITVCPAIPESVGAACDAAGDTGMVCAVGSLYSVGAIRACLDLH